MAYSFSNLNFKFYLFVSILPYDEDEKDLFLSITSPHFPNEKIVEFIKSEDQQLIGMNALVEECIVKCMKDEKLQIADYLEKAARKIRKSIS